MSEDMNLRKDIVEWRRLLLPFVLSLLPLIIAIAMAWGAWTAQAQAMGNSIDRLEARLEQQDLRLQAVERQNAVVLQRLDYISASQSDINTKLDRLLGR